MTILLKCTPRPLQVELVLRIKVFSLRFVLTNPVYQLDFLIVLVGLAGDLIVPVATGRFLDLFDPEQQQTAGSSISDDLKLLKSLRALRAFRVLRMLSFFQDLWFVVLQFFSSLK